jgi:hypothetical protein
MTTPEPTEPSEQVRPAEPEEVHPRGTLVILALFVVTLAALWTVVYVVMFLRGVTS